jgi:hypothetical protein
MSLFHGCGLLPNFSNIHETSNRHNIHPTDLPDPKIKPGLCRFIFSDAKHKTEDVVDLTVESIDEFLKSGGRTLRQRAKKSLSPPTATKQTVFSLICMTID